MILLICGGSIAAGFGVTKGYADILKERYASAGIEVINRSYYRHTSFDAIDNFYEDIAPFRPDFLLLHFGIDDAYFPVYRSEFKENLVHIVRMARACCDPRILLATSQIFDNPYDMDTVNIFYRTIREVACDLLCEMIPVHTYWAGHLMNTGTSNSALVQSDMRYPNERGHTVIAGAVIQTLDHLLGITKINQNVNRTESGCS